MCPVVQSVLFASSDRDVHCFGVALALLLLVCLPNDMGAACPSHCLCACDIISCSGHNLSTVPSDLPGYVTRLDLSHNALPALQSDWLPGRLDRLTVLVLSRNIIAHLANDAFAATTRLHHLDLSSNQLSFLNTSAFCGLGELEVLLLFRNQIIQISDGAFSGLSSLEKLYLGGNRLAAFPLELYRKVGAPQNLSFLDLSANTVKQVPVGSLLSLSAQQQSGIYLQGNPLVCDCALRAMLEYWEWRQYLPLLDFRREYSCSLGDGEGEEEWINCSGSPQGVAKRTVGGVYQAEPGDLLLVPCPGVSPPLQEGAAVFWVTPGDGPLVALGATGKQSNRLRVLANGTMEIRGVLPEDSGKYYCVAVRGRRWDPNETLDTVVVVGNSSGTGEGGGERGGEHFNTAFTTLASCVVSITLVLLYLYFTPCRCHGRRGESTVMCGGRAILSCANPREAELGNKRPANAGKRVVFLEPGDEHPNNCSSKPLNSANAATEGILKNGCRALEKTLIDTSHLA